jgi:predicted nucleic acid-binding protein
MPILIDSSILFAYVFRKDARHRLASDFLRQLDDDIQIVPAPILTAVFYLTSVRINYLRAVDLFAAVQRAFRIENLTTEDMNRMEAIMREYASAELDFADTAIMAVAERLNITRVATFDRRDFSIFRPTHCEYLELLP